jgi:hypothetical protein
MLFFFIDVTLLRCNEVKVEISGFKKDQHKSRSIARFKQNIFIQLLKNYLPFT